MNNGYPEQLETWFLQVENVSKKVDDLLLLEDHAFLAAYNIMMIGIGNTMNLAQLLSEVHPDTTVRERAEHIERELEKISTSLSLNRDVYERWKHIDTSKQPADVVRCIEKTLQDFRRSGVDKDASARERLKQLSEEITTVGQEYGRHIRDDVRTVELDSSVALQGLPADYIARHQPNEQGKIVITTDYPDYTPILKYATDEKLRRDLLLLFSNRAFPKNVSTLKKLLQLRHEFATTLGYPSWAEYITEDKMVQHGTGVADFIKKLDGVVRSRAQNDYQQLLEEKRKDYPDATEIFEWDISYYLERLRIRHCAIDSSIVREYFEYQTVAQGLLALTETLFGLTYVQIDDATTWHKSVVTYDVYRSAGKIGRIHLDMHPREGKYKHAAQFSITHGITGVQLPEGVLVCNVPDPNSSSEPALLDIREVETYFHEFGHLLHYLLSGKQTWYRFSGLSMEWDFVEAPSQLFEEWVWDYSVLKTFAIHYKTGEIIPKTLVDSMIASDKLGKGLFVSRQLVYTALSYELYARDPEVIDPEQEHIRLQSAYYPIPTTPGTHTEANFGHLVGYSAIYYTYMWSLVIAKDLKTAFTSAGGLLDTAVADRYRTTILEKAGSEDATDMIQHFLGRDYSFDAFHMWLKGV